MVSYRRARPDDAVRLLADLRPADRAEMEATSDRPLIDTVLHSLTFSDLPLAAEHDGVLLCLFGVAPTHLLSGTAAPWLLGTNALPPHRRTLLAEGRRFVRAALADYDRLENYVDARNRQSVGWLKRIGFDIAPAEPFGPKRLPFHRFSMGNANV